MVTSVPPEKWTTSDRIHPPKVISEYPVGVRIETSSSVVLIHDADFLVLHALVVLEGEVLVDVHEFLLEQSPLQVNRHLPSEGQDLVGLVVGEVYAELLELVLDGAAARMLAHHQLSGEPHLVGAEDFIRERVLD